MTTIYERLGGAPAVNAAVDIFYDKIIADDRVAPFFAGIDVAKQRAKQKAFMTYAFGGAPNYSGDSLRHSHASLKEKGLTGQHFGIIAEHLTATLQELNVPADLVTEVITLVASTKGEVLGE